MIHISVGTALLVPMKLTEDDDDDGSSFQQWTRRTTLLVVLLTWLLPVPPVVPQLWVDFNYTTLNSTGGVLVYWVDPWLQVSQVYL